MAYPYGVGGENENEEEDSGKWKLWSHYDRKIYKHNENFKPHLMSGMCHTKCFYCR